MSFEDLLLSEPLLRAVKSQGYTSPTAIQAQAIPFILEKKDVLGSAQTGTGKTAAFTLPLLQNLSESPVDPRHRKIRALILVPTRELALQVADSIRTYGKNLKLFHTLIYGGVSQMTQVRELRRGVDIVIATPGRLMDLMEQGHVQIRDIEMLVLDEADRMLDMGFINDVKYIVSHCPENRQSLFFSATMSSSVTRLAETILRNPEMVAIAPDMNLKKNIVQQVYHVGKNDKTPLLLHLIKENAIPSALVFTRTKFGADRLVSDLIQHGIRADAIHGDKSQAARQKALKKFKLKETKILVATDVAARGIDIDDLPYVFNYELSDEPETHVHRIGRTGRAGATGLAISFCDMNEKRLLSQISRFTNEQIPSIDSHPFVRAERPAFAASRPPFRDEKRGGFRGNNRNQKNHFQRRRGDV